MLRTKSNYIMFNLGLFTIITSYKGTKLSRTLHTTSYKQQVIEATEQALSEISKFNLESVAVPVLIVLTDNINAIKLTRIDQNRLFKRNPQFLQLLAFWSKNENS